MLKILHKSDEPCLVCGKTKNTAQVKGQKPKFDAVLCIEHVWQKVPEKPGKDEPPRADESER